MAKHNEITSSANPIMLISRSIQRCPFITATRTLITAQPAARISANRTQLAYTRNQCRARRTDLYSDVDIPLEWVSGWVVSHNGTSAQIRLFSAIYGLCFLKSWVWTTQHCTICIALWYLVRGDLRPVITVNSLTVTIVIISLYTTVLLTCFKAWMNEY